MRCDILTIFPSVIEAYAAVGVLGQATSTGVIDLRAHDLRRWAVNRYGQVDDEPYGGGPGMVLMAPVVVPAVRELVSEGGGHVVIPDPRGRTLDDAVAQELAEHSRLVFVCGRYEGLDERIHETLNADHVSLGDFVLAGGELAALAILEAAARFVPGVVGDPGSVAEDSFTRGLLDHPVYTRPREFEGLEVPPVLASGDHAAVARWRFREAIRRTLRLRPDLVRKAWRVLSAEEQRAAAAVGAEEGIDVVALVSGE